MGGAGSGADLRARGDCAYKEQKHGYMPVVDLLFPDVRKPRRHVLYLLPTDPDQVFSSHASFLSCTLLLGPISSRRICPSSNLVARSECRTKLVWYQADIMPSECALFCEKEHIHVRCRR